MRLHSACAILASDAAIAAGGALLAAAPPRVHASGSTAALTGNAEVRTPRRSCGCASLSESAIISSPFLEPPTLVP